MQKIVKMENNDILATVMGTCNRNADSIAEAFGVSLLTATEEEAALVVESAQYETAEKVAALLDYLRNVAVRGDEITDQVLRYAVSLAKEGEWDGLEDFGSDTVCMTMRGKPIKPKTV